MSDSEWVEIWNENNAHIEPKRLPYLSANTGPGIISDNIVDEHTFTSPDYKSEVTRFKLFGWVKYVAINYTIVVREQSATGNIIFEDNGRVVTSWAQITPEFIFSHPLQLERSTVYHIKIIWRIVSNEYDAVSDQDPMPSIVAPDVYLHTSHVNKEYVSWGGRSLPTHYSRILFKKAIYLTDIDIDGRWSQWGKCLSADGSTACGEESGEQTRVCESEPRLGGISCGTVGVTTESRPCTNPNCRHGGWTDWDPCVAYDRDGVVVNCGNGEQIRWCENPTPYEDGDWCVGSRTKTCTLPPCSLRYRRTTRIDVINEVLDAYHLHNLQRIVFKTPSTLEDIFDYTTPGNRIAIDKIKLHGSATAAVISYTIEIYDISADLEAGNELATVLYSGTSSSFTAGSPYVMNILIPPPLDDTGNVIILDAFTTYKIKIVWIFDHNGELPNISLDVALDGTIPIGEDDDVNLKKSIDIIDVDGEWSEWTECDDDNMKYRTCNKLGLPEGLICGEIGDREASLCEVVVDAVDALPLTISDTKDNTVTSDKDDKDDGFPTWAIIVVIIGIIILALVGMAAKYYMAKKAVEIAAETIS